jgi:peptidoglycan/LPS O-acetylase OafA/YrhL
MAVQCVSYLDSLRGLATMQVLLLHVFSAYSPDLVQSSPSAGTVAGYVRASPFFFIYDGHSAIYIFFVLSSYVLTAAFATSSATPGQLVTSRVVRLGVPALASCAFAAGLFLVFGGSNDLAATITKSRWLADQWHPLPGQSFVRDGVANALLLGYRETSLLVWFGFPAEWLQPVARSFNGPLWTLWIELYGSILIVVLSFLSRDKPIRWWAAVVLCAPLFSHCALLCFVAGHVAARYELAVREPMMNKHASGAIIAFGIFLCFRGQFWHPIFLDRLCALPATLLVPCISPAQVQLAVGAIIIFLGVMQSVPLRKLLISYSGWPPSS